IKFQERAILESGGWCSGAACFVSADPRSSPPTMGSAALPCLSLLLLLWTQPPRARGQEFRFGSCRAKGVDLQELWEAFWAVKDAVQAQDNITSARLLRREVLQDVSQENEMFPVTERARGRFLLFQRAFRRLDREAAVTKAFGEVDILLTWMERFYRL
uniref:Interleukin 24 n=1 Tax=Microcebus murinus TaxID=30608 RepID=A0A8C6EJ42_MICMU